MVFNNRLNYKLNCTWFFAAVAQQISKSILWAALAIVAATGVATATTTVTVSGMIQNAIVSALNSACNGSSSGTVIFPNGTYTVTSALHVPSFCTLKAQNTNQAILNISNNDYGIYVDGNSVTITGLILNGGGIVTTQNSVTAAQSGLTITYNTFQNITSGKYGILGNASPWANANISFNTFSNISNLAWGSVTRSTPIEGTSNDGNGIKTQAGMDQSKIEYNTFDHILADGIAMAFNASSWNGAAYTSAANDSISYNTFTNIHRMAMEIQGQSGCGSCLFTNHITNLKIAGNFAYHAYAPYWSSMGVSLVIDHAQSPLLLNNTVVGCGSSAGSYAYENSGDGQVTQGLVLSGSNSCSGSAGWPVYVETGSIGDGSTVTHRNSIFCGAPSTSSQTAYFGWEGYNNDAQPGYGYGTTVDQYNYMSGSCQNVAAPETSTLGIAFSSANNQTFPNGGTGTWSLSATDEISVRYVQFFLDGSTTPVLTQEFQDVNTNFAVDRKWLYHVAVNTSTLAGGVHTLTAKATDVSGAIQSVTQSFQVGTTVTPAIPAVSIAPGSLQFGSQQVNSLAAAQSITLTNTGTATLNITTIAINGSNASDFSESSSCGSSVAAGASCAIRVTFTPAAAGTRSATLSLTDNAATSTQSVPLSGTGAAPAPPPVPTPPSGTLPTNLPTGMLLWLANDAGVIANGSTVMAWDDQSGNGNNAVQATAVNQPTLVMGNNGERSLHFNGTCSFLSFTSLPLDGSTGASVFIVSASASDPAAGYGVNALLYWPETAYWGATFFGTYQTSSHFRFGTTQTGNEPSFAMPFTRTDSFGLSEWIHAGTTDSMWFNGQNVASYANKQQQMAGLGGSALLGQGGNNSFYSGDVSEVIVYTRGLSTAERQTVEQYLMKKYHL